MHPFRKFINQYAELTDIEWAAVESCLTKTIYPKQSMLLEEGKICRKLYFLESGFLRFCVYKDGVSVSKFFTSPPYCFTSQRSFANEIPAAEGIEALEESVVWEMSKKDVYDLFKYPSWNTFARNLIQEVQYFTEQILEDIQNNTAETRYIRMLESGSELLERVPLKHLASYLGIAPQSLSRIRKKYLDNQRKLT